VSHPLVDLSLGGRADYLLRDSLGRMLCVLEAKREDLDPYDAKEQARVYAENLQIPVHHPLKRA
jgi:type I site-specific restriction endonuclease